MRNRKIIIIVSSIVMALCVITGIMIVINKQEVKAVLAEKTEDTTPPIIKLKGNKEVTIKSEETYKEEGYSAVDNIDGSIVQKVSKTKQIINEKQYKIIYTVEDESGNIGKAERIVNIEGGGIIYLTFDDGPSTSSTPKILDILKKHNVPATFFILNYTSDTEQLVKREIAEGHAIGIHGYSHDYKKIYQSEKAYMKNLSKLQNKIYQSTGIKTTITRFPGGSSNTISSFNSGIMTRLTKKVLKEGYQYYDWNVDSDDAGSAQNAREVYENVTKQLSKRRKNIVLMHDFSGNKKTINALENIIKYGKQNGYCFEAITKDTPMIKHGINN